MTADNIELHINATLFYRVVDVGTLFATRIKDENDLYDTLHSQAMATLLTIIRSETFQGIGNRSQVKVMNKQLQSDFEAVKKNAIADTIPSATAVPVSPSAPPAVGLPSTKAADVLESLTVGFQVS